MNRVNYPPICLIFFLTLSCSILFTVPALDINDEWITVNQLYQLGNGHQIIYNEGKYGSFLSGESTPYFLERQNILGYSLALPLVSFPALLLFKYLDLWFRLLIVFLASFMLLLSGIIILVNYPQYSKIKGLPLAWILIILGFFEMGVNLAFFSPFSALDPNPVEVAAVIFSQNVLFSVFVVFLYLLCKTVFTDEWYALFGCISLTCCSSYLYWATNAKDHLMTAFLFGICLLFFIRYIKSDSPFDSLYAFFSVGLLTWVRPEVGFTTCCGLFVYYCALQLRGFRKQEYASTLFRIIIAPVSTILGLIPFFVNNYVITGNPVTPVFLSYIKDFSIKTREPSEISILQNATEIINVPDQAPVPLSGGVDYSSGIIHFFTPYWDTLLHDIFHLFLSTDSGVMGILGMTPLLMIAFCLFPLFIVKNRRNMDIFAYKIVILCILMVVMVFIAYIRSFPGLLISDGIGPDLRYLSPGYIPAGLLGLIGIFSTMKNPDWKNLTIHTLILCLIGSPIIIILLLVAQPFGGGFIEYTYTLSLAGMLAAGFVSLLIILNQCNEKWKFPLTTALPIVFVFPLSWQLMIVILFSITKFNGYPFWLPIMEHLYSIFIIPVG